MTVSLAQWRAVIGIFNCRKVAISCHVCNSTKNFVSMFEVLLCCCYYFESAFVSLLTLTYMFIFLQCHGDIEPNPGPRKQKPNYFSVCHWDLNSLLLIIFQNLYNYKHIIQFINMILFVYLRHIWIPQLLII